MEHLMRRLAWRIRHDDVGRKQHRGTDRNSHRSNHRFFHIVPPHFGYWYETPTGVDIPMKPRHRPAAYHQFPSKKSDPWTAHAARDELGHRPDQRIETVRRSARRKSAHAAITHLVLERLHRRIDMPDLALLVHQGDGLGTHPLAARCVHGAQR